MTAGTGSLLEAAKDAGVARFVQMSALGTSELTKDAVPYYRAKWAMEEAVRASGLEPRDPATELRVRGRRRCAAAVRADRQAGSPDAHRRIGDINACNRSGPTTWRARSFSRYGASGDLLVELGGPDVVDWNEFWTQLKGTLGTRRPALHLPFWFMRPQAFVLERLPSPPVTRDQLRMLQLGDNVVSDDGASMEALGLRELVLARGATPARTGFRGLRRRSGTPEREILVSTWHKDDRRLVRWRPRESAPCATLAQGWFAADAAG